MTAGSRKQLWNGSSVYGLLVVALVIVYASQVDSFKRDINKDVEYCSKSRTCTKCAEKPSCSWSLQRQTCVNTTGRPELLMVNIRAHCPQFTIVDSIVNKMHLPFTYKVKVSNDLNGFMKYLGKSNIACSLRGVTYNGTVGEEEDTINCESINNDNLEFDNQRLMIYHYSIAFNGVPLRFDDGVNSYFTVYNRHFCDITDKARDCVACSWDSELHTFYYKRCSAANMCTGLFEYSDGRNTTSFADTTADDQYNEDTIALLPESGPSANACPDMKIQSVEPLSAPWSGGTMLVITVKNHDVLSESRKVTVTVAGRDCVYPKTVNGETISCTVGPPKPNASVTGPVHVEYGPLRLTSAQTFQFVYPEPIGLSPTCGPVSGGTLLHITGRSLDAGSTATVSVGPANVPCELIARYEDRVLCVTGPSDGPAEGAVTIVFDKFLRKEVGVNSTALPSFKPVAQFVYAGDPVLDAGQPFSGIALGGTYIPVRGRHLACVSNATLYVDDPDGVRHYAGCAVRNDTFMECRSPAIKVPRPKFTTSAVAKNTAAAASLNFGFRVRFADHTLDLSPQPDFPSYRLFADPVFTDFETNGFNVTINGRHLDWGYSPSVDLRIRLHNAKGTPCTVINRQRRRIVCLRPLSSSAQGELREIYITVGHELSKTVKKKNTKKRVTDGPLDVFEAFLLIVGILTGVFFMSMLAVAVYVVWNNKWNIRRYL